MTPVPAWVWAAILATSLLAPPEATTPAVDAPPRAASPRSGAITGIASWMPPRYGRDYLALPQGPGHRVRICAARCLVMTSTDAGPSLELQRAGRVADIGVVAWERITGLDRGIGLARVTITPAIVPPETDR